MANIIQISTNKVLKITNALIQEIDIRDSSKINIMVSQMGNYIKSKGMMPIGPLIQKTSYSIDEEGKVNVRAYLIRQTNNFITKVDECYENVPVIRVRNCIYAHYVGPEEKLKFAYDKINITAFEEDISISNETYTVFIDKQDDNIVADIFVEKKSNV